VRFHGTEHADGVAASTKSIVEGAKPGDEDEFCKGFEVHDTPGYVVVVADAVDETGQTPEITLLDHVLTDTVPLVSLFYRYWLSRFFSRFAASPAAPVNWSTSESPRPALSPAKMIPREELTTPTPSARPCSTAASASPP